MIIGELEGGAMWGVLSCALFCEEETEGFLVLWWGGEVGLGSCGGERVRVIMGWVFIWGTSGLGKAGLFLGDMDFLGDSGVMLFLGFLDVVSEGGTRLGCCCDSIV